MPLSEGWVFLWIGVAMSAVEPDGGGAVRAD